MLCTANLNGQCEVNWASVCIGKLLTIETLFTTNPIKKVSYKILLADNVMYNENIYAITTNNREFELHGGYFLLPEALASYASTKHAAESQVELRFHGLSVCFISCPPCRKPLRSVLTSVLALPWINLWYYISCRACRENDVCILSPSWCVLWITSTRVVGV